MDIKLVGWISNQQDGYQTSRMDIKLAGWILNQQDGYQTSRMDVKLVGRIFEQQDENNRKDKLQVGWKGLVGQIFDLKDGYSIYRMDRTSRTDI